MKSTRFGERRGITMKRSQRKCDKLQTKIGMINEMEPKGIELQCTNLKKENLKQ